jgi:SAM-dependent methyltransferase
LTDPPLGPDDPYADIAAFYDLDHASFSDDIDLYLRLAEVVGDPILELGSGTGRVLVPLAAAGHRVTGLDRSSPMLARSRQAVADASVADRVTLVEAAMSEVGQVSGGPFGLVIFSLNGLLHLPTAAEQRAALVSARQALDPRGMLVIDALHPNPELFATFDGRVLHEGSWLRPDGARVDRFSACTYTAAHQRIHTDLWYDLTSPAGHLRRARAQFPMRYLSAPELELLLELAGFAEWRLYGSYDLDPYDDASERLIATAEVTPS